MRLSPDLMAVVGVAELGRAQVVKAIWGYIRQYNLQDPNDKRYFTTDDKLRVIFNGLQRLNCFEMNKYLSAHLSKIETDTTPNQSPASTSVSSSRKTMTPSTTDTNTDIQSPAMPGGHIYHPLSPTTPDDPFGSITRSEWELVKPMRLSADLAAIVVKAVWTYIRQCNLQDPNDKRYFTTDDKLRVIFNGLHRMSCFEINQYLESHLTEIETDTPGQNNLGTRLTAANSDPTSIDVTAAAAAAVAGLQGTHMASGHPHHLLNLTSSMDPLVSSASVVPDLRAVSSAVGLPPTPIGELKSE
ncbi:SWIB/MDM2 domain-containing protein [Syncephalis fuscata]|nr:SWIB/MDM2 domain-containing protein [Syncephalis fuscata]